MFITVNDRMSFSNEKSPIKYLYLNTLQRTLREISSNQASDIRTISVLAKSILHEFYGPQMPKHHIDYFLDEFQSIEAIVDQLKGSWRYFLIEINDIPIGYMGINIAGDKMILSKLYVLANQRNMGAGKAAMELVEKIAKENGTKSLELHVNQLNDRAIKFYENYGFKILKDITTTYDSGHTEHDYIMAKTL